MKKINYFLTVIILALSAHLLYAQSELKINSLDEQVPIDNKIKIGTLQNGIKYYIRKNQKPEKRAELRLIIKTGSITEDDNQLGLAHFVEHMCFNGTENFPKNKLVDFLESLGIRFGADLNASTGFDRTLYMLTLPTDNKEILENGIRVLEEWAHKVSFSDEEIEKERGVVLEEWRLGKGAQDRIQKKMFPKLFYNSRYALRLPIGDTAIIKGAAPDIIRKYYNDWYRPDLMGIVAVGDFDESEIETLIKKYFENIKPHSQPRIREKYEIPFHKEIIVSVEKDKELPYSNLTLFYKHEVKDQGTYRGYRQSLVEQLITAMLNARFSELTRKSDAPFLGAQSFKMDNTLGYIGLFLIGAALKTEKMLIGFDAVITEAFRMEKHGFTPTEFERAKKELMRLIEKAYNERDKTESALFARQYANHFEFGEGIPGIEYEFQLFNKFIPEITLDEVNSSAQNFIDKGSLVIAIAAPDKEGIVILSEQEVLKLYEEISKKENQPYLDKVSEEPLFKKDVKPGKIIKENFIKEINLTEYILSNGARIILKLTDFKNDEILFRAYSPGGHSLASDNQYISARSSDEIIEEAGVGSFNATALEKKLAGKIINLTPMITELTEGFNGSTTPQDIEEFLQLLHLYFTEPRLDYESFNTYFKRTKESTLNSKRSPESALRDTFQITMSNYHFRGLPLNEELINKMDADIAYDFYRSRFADVSDFTFFFIGNFKLEEFKPLIEKYIGSLPSINRKESWRDVGINPPKGKIIKEVRKGIEPKSLVMMAITGDFEYTNENRYYLQSMLDVFNIKMRERIREDKGGVYGIRAFARPEKYPKENYRITISFGCDPDRVKELTDEVNNIIQDMLENKPDELYMTKIKETQRREYEINLKRNNYWLNTLYNYYFNNEDPVQILNFLQLVEKLTDNDIQEAAKKYLETKNFVQVVLLPENK